VKLWPWKKGWALTQGEFESLKAAVAALAEERGQVLQLLPGEPVLPLAAEPEPPVRYEPLALTTKAPLSLPGERAAPVGVKWAGDGVPVVWSVEVAFNRPYTGLLTLLEQGQVRLYRYVHGEGSLSFPGGWELPEGFEVWIGPSSEKPPADLAATVAVTGEVRVEG
jgi:hypothetical protein